MKKPPLNTENIGTFCAECDQQTIEHITHQESAMPYLVTLELGYCSTCKRETETLLRLKQEGDKQ